MSSESPPERTSERSTEAPSSTPTGEWSGETRAAFEGKSFSKHYDPCQEAANKSIKCMHRNAGNKDLCNDYFQAYRDCKKAWVEARKEQKRKESKNWFTF